MKNTNYFGRICRFLGRIDLFVGFILCVGVGSLLIMSVFLPPSNSTDESQPAVSSSSSSTANPFYNAVGQNEIISWFVTGAIVSAAILAVAYLANKYNTAIRKLIAKVSKRTHTPIHMIELGSALIIWSVLIIMLIANLPYIATFLIFPFILNELFFLFGWISYDMPEYEV